MAPRRLGRRILRIVAWIVVGILTLVVGGLAAVVGALNTDWGREKLRTVAQEQLGKLVNGTVQIGTITGSPLSHFHIASLKLLSPTGEQELVTGDFSLAWDPLALLHKTFKATEVVLEGPIVYAKKEADGSLSLAHIMKPSDAPDTGPPSTWKVDLERIILRGGLFDLPFGPDGNMTLAAVDMNGHFVLDGTTKDVTLGILRATWIQRGLPLQLRARAVATPDFATVAGLEIVAGSSQVKVPYAMYGMKTGTIIASVDVALRESDAFLFWPHDMVVGDVKLVGVVTRQNDKAPFDAQLRVDGLRGNVVAKLTADPDPDKPEVRGEIHVRDLQAPGTKLAATVSRLDATFDLTGKTAQTVQGKVALAGAATVSGRRIDDLKIDATLGGGMARTDATVKAEGASLQAHADVKLGDEIAIEAARLRADVPDLGRLADGFTGHAAADVTVRGTLKSLAASGQITAGNVAGKGASVPSAKIDFDVKGLPDQLAGKVDIAADGVVASGQTVGKVRVQASGSGRTVDVKIAAGDAKTTYSGKIGAKVTLAERSTRIALADLDVTARGLRFQGHGGSVELGRNGSVKVDELELKSDAGSVAMGGELTAPRADVGRGKRFDPEGQMHIHLQDVDLGKMQATFAPDMKKIAGTVSLDAHVVRNGKAFGVQGDVLARGVSAIDKVPAVDGTMAVNLDNGKLVVTGHVRERKTGGVADLAFQSAAPRQTLDVNAWKKLDVKQALVGAIVQVRQMNIETLAKIGGLDGYSGRLDGRVVVEPGAKSLTWDLSARDVATPQVKNVELDSHGAWDGSALAAKANLRIQKQDIVGIDAKVQRGLADLLSGNLGDIKTTRFTADATSKDLPLETLKTAFKQRIRLAGKLDLDAHAEGTLADPTAKGKISLKDGRIAKVEFDTFDINGVYDSSKIQGTVKSKQKAGGTLDLEALIDRKKQNAVGAQVQAKAFDLGFIPALARSETDALAGVGGKLDADIKATIDQSGRAATGTIGINDGSFYVPTSGLISSITLKANLETGKLEVTELKGKAGSSGSLDGKATATMNGLVPTEFKLDLNLRSLPVNAGSQILQATSKAELTGKSVNGPSEWDMTATLRSTTFRLPKTKRGGGTLQATGKLDDVVFVDTPDFAQRQALLVMTGQEELDEGGQLAIKIKLVAPGGISVSGQDMDILLKPDLLVNYREGNALISGSVEVDHGYLDLFGRRWDIDRANASFSEQNPPNPRIDVEIEHAFQTTTVYVDVTGTISKPKLDFRANPGTYEQSQILSFVLGGDPDEASASDQQPLQDRAVGVASNALLGQVQSQLRDVLPIDVLNFSVGDAESTTTTRVEIGKWVSDRMFVGYQARMNAPDDENVNEAEVKFRLGRRWLLDAFFGDRSVGGADVIWSKKY